MQASGRFGGRRRAVTPRDVRVWVGPWAGRVCPTVRRRRRVSGGRGVGRRGRGRRTVGRRPTVGRDRWVGELRRVTRRPTVRRRCIPRRPTVRRRPTVPGRGRCVPGRQPVTRRYVDRYARRIAWGNCRRRSACRRVLPADGVTRQPLPQVPGAGRSIRGRPAQRRLINGRCRSFGRRPRGVVVWWIDRHRGCLLALNPAVSGRRTVCSEQSRLPAEA